LLVFQAAVSAATVFPGDVVRHLGMQPGSAEYYEHADAQLRLITRRLARGFCDDTAGTADTDTDA
jgi:hypothetical protein